MSDLYLTRRIFTNKSTVGKLIMDDLEIFTLEDTARMLKVNGATCIPSGRYQIHTRMSARYGREMPYLLDVPFFEAIMIHPGNTPEDTRGCILVGVDHPSVDFISDSKEAFNRLYPKIEQALRQGPLFINVAGGYSQEEWEAALKTPKQYA